jgi:hypothetical protein
VEGREILVMSQFEGIKGMEDVSRVCLHLPWVHPDTALEEWGNDQFAFPEEPGLVFWDLHRKPVWKPALRGIPDLSSGTKRGAV